MEEKLVEPGTIDEPDMSLIRVRGDSGDFLFFISSQVCVATTLDRVEEFLKEFFEKKGVVRIYEKDELDNRITYYSTMLDGITPDDIVRGLGG